VRGPVEGPTTGAVFEAHLERALAPALEPGRVVVVMDDPSAHKARRVRGPIEAGRAASCCFAALLAGPRPHRAGLLRARGLAAQGAGEDLRGALIEAMGRAGRDHRAGRLGLRASLRLPSPGPPAMTGALGEKTVRQASRASKTLFAVRARRITRSATRPVVRAASGSEGGGREGRAHALTAFCSAVEPQPPMAH
jgi:hypothetical protein